MNTAIVFIGSNLGTRIITWREQRIFHRLAVTPVPLSYLIAGMILSQYVVNLVQLFIVLLLAAVIGVDASLGQWLVCIVMVMIGCLTFTALGPAFATVVNRADLMMYLYVLVMLPLVFISGGMVPVEALPSGLAEVVRVLPPAMFGSLMQVLIKPLDLTTILVNAGGLIVYSAVFLWIAGRRSRWV